MKTKLRAGRTNGEAVPVEVELVQRGGLTVAVANRSAVHPLSAAAVAKTLAAVRRERGLRAIHPVGRAAVVRVPKAR